jgi:hypothetical protein
VGAGAEDNDIGGGDGISLGSAKGASAEIASIAMTIEIEDVVDVD